MNGEDLLTIDKLVEQFPAFRDKTVCWWIYNGKTSGFTSGKPPTPGEHGRAGTYPDGPVGPPGWGSALRRAGRAVSAPVDGARRRFCQGHAHKQGQALPALCQHGGSVSYLHRAERARLGQQHEERHVRSVQ